MNKNTMGATPMPDNQRFGGGSTWPGYNDLATKNPTLAAQWHPTKNGGLTPADVTPSSKKKVWWLLPYDDPETGRHFDFEWMATVSARTHGAGCPLLRNSGIA